MQDITIKFILDPILIHELLDVKYLCPTDEEFEVFIREGKDNPNYVLGLYALLKLCEEKEYYEYCSILKKYIDENNY